MPKHAGFDCEISIGGVTVGLASDVTINMSTGSIDVTTRDNTGWRDFISGLSEWSVDFTLLSDRPNDQIAAIETAFLNKTDLTDVEMVDGDGYGWNGTVRVIDYTKNEALEDGVNYSVTFQGRGAPTAVTPSS